jgi:hypothetical protein
MAQKPCNTLIQSLNIYIYIYIFFLMRHLIMYNQRMMFEAINIKKEKGIFKAEIS